MMMTSEQFEMREVHRALLIKHRIYLLHNLRPTETLWSTLHAKQVLPADMIEDIKACKTMSSQVGRLMDLLPARGPNAFDQFCEALLECDHAHVAEYLKTLEATDHFRTELQPHCLEMSDHMTEKLVSIFKRNTPAVQRFAERKFELMLSEQERDLRQREEDVKSLESQNLMLSLEVSQLRTFINSCKDTSENIVVEIQRDFLSKMFLREEKKHLENLKTQLQGIVAFDKVSCFYTNMQTLLTYLENYAGMQSRDKKEANAEKTPKVRQAPSAHARSLHDKMLQLKNMLVELTDGTATMSSVPGHTLRTELEKILNFLNMIMEDVWKIHDMFKSTMRQKRKMEGEVLSLLHNFQEIRRLEREVKEKQTHISDLTKQGQVMKKKTKSHRKQLDQIYLNMEQRKIQLRELQTGLERQLNSADQRLHHMLILLPDMEEGELARSDTEMTSEAGSLSRMNTPGSAVRRRPVSSHGIPPVTSRPINVMLKLTDMLDTSRSAADDKESRIEKTHKDNLHTDEDTKTQQNVRLGGRENTSVATSSKTGVNTNVPSGGVTKGLLERRKAKQAGPVRDSTQRDTNRRFSKDSRQVNKYERSSRLSMKMPGDQSRGKESEKDDVVDLDSWIEHEKSKVGEMQQKLSQFKVVPTKDRTSEMESVRMDIDVKINAITRKPSLIGITEPDSTETDVKQIESASDIIEESDKSKKVQDKTPGSRPSSGSGGSRSTSGSNKENSTPNRVRLKSVVGVGEMPSVGEDKNRGGMTARRPSYMAPRREFTAANMTTLTGAEIQGQETSLGLKVTESQENIGATPKKRFVDREALKANRIELRLPSK